MIIRIVAVLIFFSLITGGCTSARRAYMIKDYEGIGGLNVTQKFFVESIKFKNTNARIPVEEFAKHVPELFNSKYKDGDIPIRIEIEYGEWRKKTQFFYSLFSILTLTFIPYENINEISARVDVFTANGEKLVPSTNYITQDSEKESWFLFLGGIKYGKVKGFPSYAWGDSIQQIVNDKGCTEQFVLLVSRCVAQQLKTYALDRITTPKIQFDIEK